MKFLSYLSTFLMLSFFLTSCGGPEGEAAETKEAAPAATADSGSKSYAVVADVSKVMWEGSKPGKSHFGSIDVSKGSINVEGGKITAGKFTLDMNSITCTDLTGDQKEGLESHLKGTQEGKEDHFFNVAKHPTGEFVITKVVGVDGNPKFNSTIYGNLTLKGVSKEISFPATVNVSGKGVTANTPPFTINRTDWGIEFMSQSLGDDFKEKFINDNIGMTLNIVAQ